MKYKKLHPWNVIPQKAVEIQNKLRRKLSLKRKFKKINLIASADVAYKNGMMYCVAAVFNYPSLEVKEVKKSKLKERFPYIPTLLTFREGPVLLRTFSKLKSNPDLVILDGQGIAHPRKMGEATHIGILLKKPTIGCAKSKLFGEFLEPKMKRGSFSYIFDGRNIIGAVVRTKDNVKPVFVSQGYGIDLHSSIKIILLCSKGYRFPEPIRYVHQSAKRFSNEQNCKSKKSL